MSETVATDAASPNGTAGLTEHALKPTAVAPEAIDPNEDDAGEEDDGYDFEEEQQAVEGEEEEYREDDDEDDDYEEDAGGEVGDLGEPDVAAEPQASEAAAPAANGKPSLTALLLGDPNAAEEDEDDYDEEEEDDDEEDDFIEEATPITPTSKKRAIEETLEEGDNDEDEAVSKKVKSGKPIVIKFWAQWCGPCNNFAPKFKQLSDEEAKKGSKVEFYRLDIDEQPELSDEVGVQATPHFFSFKNGKKVGDIRGANLDGLRQLIYFTAALP
ncbi:hypothetical protein EST38_g13115 [Candolleomyces aberdarensis]|uniref:Thioredoxin domain-containing protein n=1 Tax=Candolleomyces aberdarensis TaxID=2316362 RepID=A0A4Q2D0Q4_9AGAR|nr:hypothetical protein EST38_g13115 [Candolleomyces aberdarensis]